MFLTEEWRDIPDIGVIQISNFGNIRTKDRLIPYSDGRKPRLVKGQLLKQQRNRYGYLKVRASLFGEKITLTPHRLVAELFVPNPSGKPQVNHIDGVKSNNVYTNLEWVTNSENQKHAAVMGLREHKFGEFSSRFGRFVEATNIETGDIIVLAGNKELAENGFDFRLVSACIKGKRKSHKGYTFKAIYKEEQTW